MNYKDTILQWQEYILSKKLFKRNIKNPELFTLSKIISFLGWRRTGKTSLMIQLIQEMLTNKEIHIEQIVFIDFSQLENHKIDLIQIYQDYKNNKISPIFILDEIQELDNFDKIIWYLYEQSCKIFVSGSNSKLLSQEISTKLRWRSIEYHNDVLDFDEFLIFKSYKGPKDWYEYDKLFDEYLQRGWYPEVVSAQGEETKKALLQWYFDLIIYRDIIDRYRIKNQEILGHLIKSLIVSHTKQLNINKLFNTYKSLWYEVSKNTLYQYVQYLEQNFFVSKVKNFYKKSYFDKIYIIDNGYMNLFDSQTNYGQKFENIIYKYLIKNNKHIWYSDEKYDIDFTDWETNRQICYQLTIENKDREYKFAWSDKKNILIYKTTTLPILSQKNLQFLSYREIDTMFDR